jgi:hypothetical protein
MDPIYCSFGNLICQPLEWWSSAAAWAQAVLTVATFAATVIYQAAKDISIQKDLRMREAQAQLESERQALALARLVAGRHLRRWRRELKAFLGVKHATTADRSRAIHVLCGNKLKWDGSMEQLEKLGPLAPSLLTLAATIERLSETVDGAAPDEWERLSEEDCESITTMLRDILGGTEDILERFENVGRPD